MNFKLAKEPCCRWSAKFGEYPAGDPEIHHVAGQLYAEGTFRFQPSYSSAGTFLLI